jgi:hypothetical protein
MIGFIYLTTNNISGKKYIGRKTYSKNWETYLGSSWALLDDIDRLGASNFTRVLLQDCETAAELEQQEIYWQKKYRVKEDPMFYNLTYATEGFDTTGAKFSYSSEQKEEIWSEERRKKCSERMKDKSINPNYRKDVAKARSERMKRDNPFMRDDVKLKIRKSRLRPFILEYEGKQYRFDTTEDGMKVFGNAAAYIKLKGGVKKNNPYKGLKLIWRATSKQDYTA